MKQMPTKMLRVMRNAEVLGHLVKRTDGRWTFTTQRGDLTAAFEAPSINPFHPSRQWWPSRKAAVLRLLWWVGGIERMRVPVQRRHVQELRLIEMWRSAGEEVLSVAS